MQLRTTALVSLGLATGLCLSQWLANGPVEAVGGPCMALDVPEAATYHESYSIVPPGTNCEFVFTTPAQTTRTETYVPWQEYLRLTGVSLALGVLVLVATRIIRRRGP